MLLFLLLTLLLIFISYVFLRWIGVKQYWAKRNVPHMPPHPIFGNFNFLFKENISIWSRRMYSREPYVGIWIFWRPTLLVNSPEIAKNILIKDQANFRNRLATFGTTDPIGQLNLFMLDDPLWTLIRRRLSTLFTGSKLRGIQKLVTKKSKELVQRIDVDRQKSIPVDLKNVMTDFSTDIIATSSFGVVSDALLTGTSHFKQITETLMTFSVLRGLSWCCGCFIPELVDVFRFKMFPTESVELMRKIFREAIAQRGGFEDKIIEPKDLLDILIKIKQESDQELEVTEDMLLAQATIFLQAGFDTTATSLSFVIYELAFNPEVQEMLYRELQKAKDQFGDDLLQGDILSQLTYLNCVINEGLRKYPIASWLDRIALMDYKLDDRLTIKAGTPIYVNIMGMHYDPDFFPEPDVFNPDRFLPENKSEIELSAYLPFGEGPRKCIGQRLGLSNMRHGLAATILSYEVRPLPDTPKPLDIKLDKKNLMLSPEGIISVDFVPRQI